MGQSKSKHIYSFQPLPWPEALAAFRLVDQICGIASTYATTHLDKHATLVLDKVNELQRLPHLWDAFETDFESLRGTHMVQLATKLHSALEQLEGCKYDMGLLAEKDLTFKSRRQAAEKVLAILREVEEAHRAFYSAFELALYGSLRQKQAEMQKEDLPESPTAAVSRSVAVHGAPISSGGGTTVANYRRILSEAAELPPPPPAPEESWLQEVQSSLPTPLRPTSPAAGDASGRPPPIDNGEISPSSLRRPPPLSTSVSPAAAPRSASTPQGRPQTADVGTMSRYDLTPVTRPLTAPPLPEQPLSPYRARSPMRLHSSRSHSETRRRPHGSGRWARDRSLREIQNPDHQFVVMYLPQAPDGSGPRAILVPAGALQPAPSSPGPGMPATTVMGGMSPFATNGRAAFAALPALPPPQPPAAAAAWSAGQYLNAPSQSVLPPQPLAQHPHSYHHHHHHHQQQQQQQQQQQSTTFMYPPSASPPPPPAPQSPPLYPYRNQPTFSRQPYTPPTAPTSHLTHTYSAGSAVSSYGSPYLSSARAQPVSYRYFTPPPLTAAPLASTPSFHTAPAGWQGASAPSPSYDISGKYSTDLHRSTQSPTVSLTASGTPNLNSFFDRPNLSGGGGSSGGWLSPLAMVAATAAATNTPSAALTASAPVGAVAGIVPGVGPGSVMMLQPVSAQPTATGGLMLQPQSNPMQPPLLVVATAPPAPQHSGPVVSSFPDGGISGDRGNANERMHAMSSGRVRFLTRDDGGGSSGARQRDKISDMDEAGGGQSYLNDEDADEFARESSGTNGSHQTYSYGLRHRVQPAPTYLSPYTGDVDDGYDLPNFLESHSSGRLRRRFSDGGNRSGGGGNRNTRPRDRSGGKAKELVNHFRGRSWDDDEEQMPVRVARQPRSVSPSQWKGTVLSREAELSESLAPLAAAAVAVADSRPRQQSSSGRASPLSYERLAALAGLDIVAMGAGAVAGLASRVGHSTVQSAQTKASVSSASPFAVAPQRGPRAHRPIQLVPGEPSLRRAELLSEAIEGGDWAAAVELAGMVRAGWWGDLRDGAVSRGLLLQAALRGGSADAHAALGHMAERGEGLPGGHPDLVAAARHYGAAAAGGHRDATTALAYLLEHGLGVQQDEPRAAQLYAAAAQRNCPTASNNLAKMILDARGATAAATVAAAAAAAAATSNKDGAGAISTVSSSPMALAKALLKRAARAGSASAWYNLGVCHLQQLKQRDPVGGASLAAVVRGEIEAEALHCFAEAAKRGHARAALRAGYLHLQRSAAAGAVSALCDAALNATVALAASPAKGPGTAPADVPALPVTGSGAGGAIAVEAEALWCLAQLAERQAAVLEVRKTSGVAGPAVGAGTFTADRQGHFNSGVSGSRDRKVSGDGGEEGGGGRGDAHESERDKHNSHEGDDGDNITMAAAAAATAASEPAADDDASSNRTGGTESRAVGKLLATLAGAANIQGPDGAATVAGAAAAASGGDAEGLDDPAAAAAVRFAKEICRLDFSCCHRPSGHLPFISPPNATSADLSSVTAAKPSSPMRGLRRLRQQAREVLLEDASPSDAAAVTPGSLSEASSADGGGGASPARAATAVAPMAAALARLELELQQPEERARRARRAAAELMAAAAALGHAPAQHWLAGWKWSMNQQATAVALWEAAGKRGHGPSLMVLGQMAEAGQLPGQDGSGGADLASAARYYLRAQEAGAQGAVESMRRVQKLLQRHVTLQGKLEAVAAGGGTRAVIATAGRGSAVRRL